MKIRKSAERGMAEHGWLKSYHSFSFANYYDPAHMGFRDLRVINEDFIEAGQGFGTHPHQNMEIITYVIKGSLSHKDSMGNGSTIKPGDVQYMSAGSGVTHSEFSDPQMATHLLQIWILPNAEGEKPRYDQKNFPATEKQGKLKLLASNDGRDGSIAVRQDIQLYASILDRDAGLNYEIKPNRHAWLQLISGKIEVNGEMLHPGDAAAFSKENNIALKGIEKAEFLLFDLN